MTFTLWLIVSFVAGLMLGGTIGFLTAGVLAMNRSDEW